MSNRRKLRRRPLPPVIATDRFPCPCGCGESVLAEYRQPENQADVEAIRSQTPPPGRGQVHYFAGDEDE